MKKQLFVGAATLALAATGVSQAHASGVVHLPLRTGEAHEIIAPWLIGTIDLEGVAQEAPGPGDNQSIITATCAATLYSANEQQYQSINQCTLKDLTTGASYPLWTILSGPNDLTAAGTFTVAANHDYAICPQVQFVENSGSPTLTPPSGCGKMAIAAGLTK
jgi:hypothetical protein